MKREEIGLLAEMILGGGKLCQHGIDVTKKECIHCTALDLKRAEKK